MKDHNKTKKHPASEVRRLRQPLADLEKPPNDTVDGNVGTATAITNLNGSEQALNIIIEGTSSLVGQEFFKSLVRLLASALDVKCAFVAECANAGNTRMRTIAYWHADAFQEETEFELDGSQCERIIVDKVDVYDDNVLTLFPRDRDTQDLAPRHYVGTAVFSSQGSISGHLVIMDDRPIPGDLPLTAILRVMAARAGAELERKRAHIALQKSEERYRTLYENNPSMYFTVDAKGTVVSVNEFGANQLGYSVSELAGQSVLNVFHPNDKGKVLDQLDECLRHPERLHHWELRKVRKDGSTLWVEEFARCLPGDTGYGKVLVVCQDVTERRQAEEALRLKEQQYRDIFETVIDGVFITDFEGTIVEVNPAACKMYGYSYEELIGLPAKTLVHPESRGIFEESLRSFELGQTLHTETIDVRKDGAAFPVEVSLLDMTFRETPHLLGIVRDISERKQAEELIRLTERRYRELFEFAPTMYVITRDHNDGPLIVDCNESFLQTLGYSREEILNRSVADFYSPASRAELRNGYQPASQEQFLPRERQLISAQGRVIETLLTALPERDIDGSIIGKRAMFLDITERKHAEEALQKAHDELERRVDDRTAELRKANKALKVEIAERKNAEKELVRQQNFVRLVADNATSFIFVKDSEGRFLFVNKAMADAFGMKPDEIVRKHNAEIHSVSEEVAAYLAADNEVLRTLKTIVVEETQTLRDGRVLHFHTVKSPIRLDEQTVHVLGVSTDITQRKLMEQTLIESQALLKCQSEAAIDGIAVVSEDRKWLHFNQRFLEMLDLSELVVEGGSTKAALRAVTAKVVDRAKFLADIDRLYDNPELTSRDEIRLKDGRVLDRYTAPVKSPQNQFYGRAWYYRDITELKQAEQALRESEERFSKAFHTTPVAICISQLENAKYLDVNHRFLEMFGYEREDIIGRSALEIGIWSQSAERARLVTELKKTGSVRGFETRILTKTGDLRDVLGSAELVELGGQTCILAMLEDVTERKRAQEAGEKLRQKTIRSAAIVEAQENERRRISQELHDGLGQILTAIKFNLETLEDAVEQKAPEQLKTLHDIKENLNNAVAEGERISYNLMPRVLDDFGIVPALEVLCDQLSKQSSTTVTFYNHGIKKRLPPSIEMGLYRIAQEALNNVVKHANAGETDVQVINHATSITLTIDDDGVGFRPEPVTGLLEHEHGMGLMNIRERTEALNGTLTIDSQPGKGTEIIVELPMKEGCADGRD